MYIHDDLQQRWWDLEAKLVERFGKKPDIEAVLFFMVCRKPILSNKKLPKNKNRT